MWRRDRRDEAEDILHEACRKGLVNTVHKALERDDVDVNAYNKSGETALHALMSCDSDVVPEIVDLLVENGADVNTPSLPDGDTCLHKAMKCQTDDRLIFTVLSLLENEADPLIKNKSFRTAYDIAVSKGHTQVLKILDCDDPESVAEEFQEIASKRYGQQLIKAVIGTDDDGIDESLSNDPPLDVLNEHGAGAIHYAVTRYRGDVISLLERLIDAGADVNFEDLEGDTALNLALKTRRLKVEGSMDELVHFFVLSGTDPSVEDLDGNNAMDLAAKFGYEHLLDTLEEAAENKYLTQQERRERVTRRLERARETLESRVELRDDDSYDWGSQADEQSVDDDEEEEDSRAKQNWGKAKSKATKICVVS